VWGGVDSAMLGPGREVRGQGGWQAACCSRSKLLLTASHKASHKACQKMLGAPAAHTEHF
jgi:hypothetical protein